VLLANRAATWPHSCSVYRTTHPSHKCNRCSSTSHLPAAAGPWKAPIPRAGVGGVRPEIDGRLAPAGSTSTGQRKLTVFDQACLRLGRRAAFGFGSVAEAARMGLTARSMSDFCAVTKLFTLFSVSSARDVRSSSWAGS